MNRFVPTLSATSPEGMSRTTLARPVVAIRVPTITREMLNVNA